MRCNDIKRRIAVALVSGATLGAMCTQAAVAQSVGEADSPSLSQLKGVADNTDSTSNGRAPVDGIAAVVNQNVITLRQLEAETHSAQAQLQSQNIPVPDMETLKKQVLQRMISAEIERQEAQRLDIEVTDVDIQEAVKTIAERNQISAEQLRHEVERTGVSWDAYLKNLRHEVRLDMLRQRVVDNTIMISDAEVDAFLRTEGKQISSQQAPAAASQPPVAPAQSAPASTAAPHAMGLAHILVEVPEGASSSQVAELRNKAESILASVRGGADFSGVAASSSDGPEALDGGKMGERPIEGWPDLFIKATKGLNEGDVTDVFQSGNGFHILKVVTLHRANEPSRSAQGGAMPAPAAPSEAFGQSATPAAPQGSSMVTQTHARHILIKTSQVVSDEQAEQRLLQLQQRLSHGESFEDLAKQHSDDGSAPQGGDLGWLTPGETVPAFEQAMNALEPGQTSGPVQSQFGWHLIQVIERRTKDMEDEFKRMQARQLLFQRRVEPALEDWLSQLRGQAYIENRIDPERSRSSR